MRINPVTVPISIGPTSDEVRAIADQMGTVAIRWHSLAVEMDKLATSLAALNPPEEST